MKRINNLFFWLNVMMFFLLGCTKDLSPGTISSKLTIATPITTNIAQSTAISGVQISGIFSSDVKDKGVCWSATNAPTINDTKISGGAGTGFVTLTLTGLTPGSTYYLRSYVTTANETIYGNQQQFNTQGYLPATLTTTAVTNITLVSALSGGNVTALGGGSVTAKGVCWNTVGSPTILNNKTNDGSGLGAYSSVLNALTPGTVYYIRAYATNQAGTVYGTQLSFTTVGIALATVSSPVIGSITQTTAISSATVIADGGGSITAKGVCWSPTSTPTIANYRTIDGLGTGAYNSALSSLNPGTFYYVRAYATNAAGTAYGPLSSFTTNSVQPATITSMTISNITKISVIVSANVTSDGGGTISSRGVCWSTGTNPTVPVSSYTNNGSGIGIISGTITGLVTGTTYYIRAYAVNSTGTTYGALISFRTL